MSKRILFTSIGSTGHLHPLVPYAEAARAAGHSVAFATPPVAVPVVEALGFAAFPLPPDRSGIEAVQMAGLSLDGLSVEQQNVLWGRYWILGDHLVERTRHLVNLVRSWNPDVIVRGEIEYAGCLAAELLDLPHASIKAYAHLDTREVPEYWRILLDRLPVLREQVGLEPDPDLVMPYRYLEVWPFPRSFRIGPYPAATCRAARPVPFDQSGAERLPNWIWHLPPRERVPRVYITLGTTGLLEQRADVFAKLLAGLRHQPFSLIITVSRAIDPKRFGPQPPNVHIEQYIPQTLVLPYCDAVVSHAGSGTILSALDEGLPQVMIPLSADQPLNATAALAAGYAVSLSKEELTSQSIQDAVRTILNDPKYRTNARRIRDEVQAMPDPDEVVRWFEELAHARGVATPSS